MAAPKKPTSKPSPKPMPKPKPAAPKPKMAKPVAKKSLGTSSFYNQSGMPDPNGLYDRDGYMVKVPGKRNKFPGKGEGERSAEDIASARRAGFNR
jgi:hypothetical protein